VTAIITLFVIVIEFDIDTHTNNKRAWTHTEKRKQNTALITYN